MHPRSNHFAHKDGDIAASILLRRVRELKLLLPIFVCAYEDEASDGRFCIAGHQGLTAHEHIPARRCGREGSSGFVDEVLVCRDRLATIEFDHGRTLACCTTHEKVIVSVLLGALDDAVHHDSNRMARSKRRRSSLHGSDAARAILLPFLHLLSCWTAPVLLLEPLGPLAHHWTTDNRQAHPPPFLARSVADETR